MLYLYTYGRQGWLYYMKPVSRSTHLSCYSAQQQQEQQIRNETNFTEKLSHFLLLFLKIDYGKIGHFFGGRIARHGKNGCIFVKKYSFLFISSWYYECQKIKAKDQSLLFIYAHLIKEDHASVDLNLLLMNANASTTGDVLY